MTFLLPFPLPLGLQISAIDNSLVKDLFQFLLQPVITISLSLFLIFKYLSSYKNPEDLAFDLSLSALLGDNIYNFRELLAHPIVSIYL
ncbi:26S proteasome regulatory subunit RPN9 [Gossypium arboreum]|uniref:26S proteasome regulatory subunit RPN9 n=1 Tax=Gossypium arboreum TaxID=29729 RepID=A0A0B0PRX9_GOSAR|nr:26S proteasome regulatory subunit RPN9 [Gossypium arboreum]